MSPNNLYIFMYTFIICSCHASYSNGLPNIWFTNATGQPLLGLHQVASGSQIQPQSSPMPSLNGSFASVTYMTPSFDFQDNTPDQSQETAFQLSEQPTLYLHTWPARAGISNQPTSLLIGAVTQKTSYGWNTCVAARTHFNNKTSIQISCTGPDQADGGHWALFNPYDTKQNQYGYALGSYYGSSSQPQDVDAANSLFQAIVKTATGDIQLQTFNKALQNAASILGQFYTSTYRQLDQNAFEQLSLDEFQHLFALMYQAFMQCSAGARLYAFMSATPNRK